MHILTCKSNIHVEGISFSIKETKVTDLFASGSFSLMLQFFSPATFAKTKKSKLM